MRVKIWKSGLPYQPDVERLAAAIPSPKAGDMVSHEFLEDTLGLKRGGSRYYSVIRSWKRQYLAKENLDAAYRKGKGYAILTGPERIKVCEEDLMRAAKMSRKAAQRTISIPEKDLSEINRNIVQHMKMIAYKVNSYADETRKQILIQAGAVKSLPKPKVEDLEASS